MTVKDDTLYVSNNGNSIFIFKIVESNDGMSLNLVQSSSSIKLPSPVNHSKSFPLQSMQLLISKIASISPNGQWLLAVTDTPTAYLFTLSPTNSNNPWILHQKISESKGDASFSTAWSENSNKFAIGSQCGTCNVYNIIDGQVEKIVTLRGRGAGAWGAIRKVNFFKIGSVELLAFSEVSFDEIFLL